VKLIGSTCLLSSVIVSYGLILRIGFGFLGCGLILAEFLKRKTVCLSSLCKSTWTEQYDLSSYFWIFFMDSRLYELSKMIKNM